MLNQLCQDALDTTILLTCQLSSTQLFCTNFTTIYVFIAIKQTHSSALDGGVDGQLEAAATLPSGRTSDHFVRERLRLSGRSVAVQDSKYRLFVCTSGGSLVAKPTEHFRLHNVSAAHRNVSV
jgi:hypothetical protein